MLHYTDSDPHRAWRGIMRAPVCCLYIGRRQSVSKCNFRQEFRVYTKNYAASVSYCFGLCAAIELAKECKQRSCMAIHGPSPPHAWFSIGFIGTGQTLGCRGCHIAPREISAHPCPPPPHSTRFRVRVLQARVCVLARQRTRHNFYTRNAQITARWRSAPQG